MKNKRRWTSRQCGFSMIELLVVTTIIIVLTTIGLVSFSTTSKRSRDSRREADMAQLRAALEVYRSMYGSYPNVASFASLMSTANFTRNLPSDTIQDPSTSHPQYTYRALSSGRGYEVCFTNEASDLICSENP